MKSLCEEILKLGKFSHSEKTLAKALLKAIEKLEFLSKEGPHIPEEDNTYEGLDGNAGDVYYYGCDVGRAVLGDLARDALQEIEKIDKK